MKSSEWIDANAAYAVLGPKAQTLYTYVSRHHIRTKTDPSDARHSLYFRPDLDQATRNLPREDHQRLTRRRHSCTVQHLVKGSDRSFGGAAES